MVYKNFAGEVWGLFNINLIVYRSLNVRIRLHFLSIWKA